MKLRSDPIEIPKGNPFKHDALKRQPIVEALTAIVRNVAPPFVLCIDSPWGTGKSTFLALWKASLEGSDIHPLYFNAWKNDFVADPLIAFVSEISDLIREKQAGGKPKHLERAKKIASLLAKRALPVAGKIATAGILDLDEVTEAALSEFVSESVKDATDAFAAQKNLIDQFRKELSKLIEELPAKDGAPRLLVLVDELDRCRPSYALELLERIKHLFDVENVVFVLALDKRQLRATVKYAYGMDADADDYLRRFIDLEYRLPNTAAAAYPEYLRAKFGLDDLLSKRVHPELQYESKNLLETFSGLANVFELSLRAQEQCIARIKLAILATPNDHYLFPNIVAGFTVLRTAIPDDFRTFVGEHGRVKQLIAAITARPGGSVFMETHQGLVFESYLLIMRRVGSESQELSEVRKAAQEADTKGLKDTRPQKIVELLQYMARQDRSMSLEYVLSKIELGVAMQ